MLQSSNARLIEISYKKFTFFTTDGWMGGCDDRLRVAPDGWMGGCNDRLRVALDGWMGGYNDRLKIAMGGCMGLLLF